MPRPWRLRLRPSRLRVERKPARAAPPSADEKEPDRRRERREQDRGDDPMFRMDALGRVFEQIARLVAPAIRPLMEHGRLPFHRDPGGLRKNT